MSIYVALVLGAALFGRIWLASIRQMAALIDDPTSEEIERIQAHHNGAL